MKNENILQKEYLDQLKEDVQRGIIKLEEDEQYFDKLENRFPAVEAGTAWDDVDDYLFFDLGKLKDDQAVYDRILQENFQEIIQLLWRIGVDKGQEIVIIGDGVLDTALRIPFEKLMDLYHEVFALPQHTYILPLDASWCINYTFEDELFFVVAPTS